MNVGVIVESKKLIEEITESLDVDIVFLEAGTFTADQTDELLLQAARVDMKALIVSLKAIQEEEYLAKTIRKYRVIRPHTQIIVLAENRKPGDETISRLVNLAVYDIIAATTKDIQDDEVIDYGTYISKQLNTPATFANAERWRVGIDEHTDSKNEKSLKNNLTVVTKEKIMGSVLVGITSAKAGAGSTFVSIQVAHYLANYGNTAVVELVDKTISNTAFNSINSEDENCWHYQGVDYYVIEKDKDYQSVLQQGYTYIVLDFGYLFSHDKKLTSKYIAELGRCSVRIVACGSQEWQFYYFANTYIKLQDYCNKWSVLFSPGVMSDVNKINKEIKHLEGVNAYCNPYMEDPYDCSSYNTNQLELLLESIIPRHLLNKQEKPIWKRWLS